MKTELDCIPCFVRQALEAIQEVVDTPEQRERLFRKLLREISLEDWNLTPPAVSQRLHRLIRQDMGGIDPYRAIKAQMNAAAKTVLPTMRAMLAQQSDRQEALVRLAIGGNMLDAGAKTRVSIEDLPSQMQTIWDRPLLGEVDGLFEEANRASSILYLADNAGEIFFDRELIAALPPGRVTVAVRGSPVLNDATREDALEAEIDSIAEIIDNGSDAPGTVLADCSADFQSRFVRADMVIAKGQGNYETLSSCKRRIYYLFVVKCPAVASRVGAALGTLVATT